MSEESFQACEWCRTANGLAFVTWRSGSEVQRAAAERALKCGMSRVNGGLRVAIDVDGDGVYRFSGETIHVPSTGAGLPGTNYPMSPERWETVGVGDTVRKALTVHGLRVAE